MAGVAAWPPVTDRLSQRILGKEGLARRIVPDIGEKQRRLTDVGESPVHPRDQLVVGGDEGLVGGRAGVPAVVAAPVRQGTAVLHERDAASLDGVGDHDLRPVGDPAKLRPEPLERGMIVAVAASDVPAGGTELRLDVAEGDDFIDQLVGLDLVVIDDHRQAGHPLLERRLEAS